MSEEHKQAIRKLEEAAQLRDDDTEAVRLAVIAAAKANVPPAQIATASGLRHHEVEGILRRR